MLDVNRWRMFLHTVVSTQDGDLWVTALLNAQEDGVHTDHIQGRADTRTMRDEDVEDESRTAPYHTIRTVCTVAYI